MVRPVHYLDPALVQASSARRIAEIERWRAQALSWVPGNLKAWAEDQQRPEGKRLMGKHAPWDEAACNAYYDKRVAEELDYYAKVRVVELAPDRFILVYGDADDQTVEIGTGPSKTLQKAMDWFLQDGR
uniref:Uncharacterized protein n=1 Tax=Caulobacter phage BL57 TaxID=3348355 RepID=A0AB74UH48_9VIRU